MRREENMENSFLGLEVEELVFGPVEGRFVRVEAKGSMIGHKGSLISSISSQPPASLLYKHAKIWTAKAGWARIALVWSGRDSGSPRRSRGRIACCRRLPLWTVERMVLKTGQLRQT